MSKPKLQPEPSMEEILASIRRIISAEGREGREKEVRAEGEAEEVLELTEEAPADPEESAASEPPRGPVIAARPFAVPDPEPEPDEFEAPRPEEAPPRGRLAELDQTLISKGAQRASEKSLATLAAAVGRRRHNPALGMSERTLEDLVKEVMRPMIREWMDANLPGLVERLVEREIERLSRRAEDRN